MKTARDLRGDSKVHARCLDCGGEAKGRGVVSIKHRPDCPQLQPALTPNKETAASE